MEVITIYTEEYSASLLNKFIFYIDYASITLAWYIFKNWLSASIFATLRAFPSDSLLTKAIILINYSKGLLHLDRAIGYK